MNPKITRFHRDNMLWAISALAFMRPLATAAAARALAGIPFSDHLLPITGKIQSSEGKTQPLREYMHWVSSSYSPAGEGNGTQVSLDAPYGGAQYTVNVSIAGADYNLILDTGRCLAVLILPNAVAPTFAPSFKLFLSRRP